MSRIGLERPFAVGALFAVACQTVVPAACLREDSGSARLAIVGGSPDASYLDLTRDEQAAIVSLRGADGALMCTGVVIAPGWLLSAAHCREELASVGVSYPGLDGAEQAEQEVAGDVYAVHPELDLMLVTFAASSVSSASPVALATSSPSAGTQAQLGGFGAEADGAIGRRRFAVEEVTTVDDRMIVVDGQGRSGACRGDSGGPLLIRDLDGSVAVAGILSGGSANCRGIDRYVRVDTARTWIESVVGVPLPRTPSCGGIEWSGRCFGDLALWCDAGTPVAELCNRHRTCGWLDAVAGYRCVAEDPCGGAPEVGMCSDDTVLRCDDGLIEQVSCGDCSAVCVRDSVSGRAVCAATSR